MNRLGRWWRALWGSHATPTGPATAPADVDATPAAGGGGVADDTAPRARARRRYASRLPDSDPRLEAHLGAVLLALAGGPLTRGELTRRVDAADWGPGRLDAVVDHGIAVPVLLDDGDDAVRARYAD